MFQKPFFILAFLFFIPKIFSQDCIEDFFSSPPGQITLNESSDFLIGGIIHPLSGQPCLRQTDLIAKGAQSLELKRIFIPFYTALNENKGKIHPAKAGYGGWVTFPHAHLNVFKKGKNKGKKFTIIEMVVSTSDPQGNVFAYLVDSNGRTSLKTKPWGICNGIDDHPSGMLDPRNTKISIDKTNVTLQAPDGTKREYRCSNYYEVKVDKKHYACLYCLLLKETLPNGNILRYSYNNERQVIKVESMDPYETHVYSTLTLDIPVKGSQAVCSTNTGLQATYEHDTAAYFKKDKHGHFIDLIYPLRFNQISSPCFRNEVVKYETASTGDSHLTEYVGKHSHFKCTCSPVPSKNKKEKKLWFVDQLKLPSETADFPPVYSMSYVHGIRGEEPSSTTVTHSDGLKTVYTFNHKMLPERVLEHDQYGGLAKEKIFTWTPNQWLQSITITDGRQILSKKEFEYDSFGNPILEIITADLTGSNSTDSNEIKRVFSTDNRNLLLQEEFSNGKIISYTYLPETNLLTSRLIKDQNGILTREFRRYDRFHNLIQIINDDGSSDLPGNLSNVTERKITNYLLREQPPFLHMPEWIEIKYLENGMETLFQKTHLIYDQWGNIIQNKVYDSEKLLYTIHKEYDEQGNLLSETNPLGQKNNYTYDEHGRKTTSLSFSNTLYSLHYYDSRGRLLKTQETTFDGMIRNYSYIYDDKSRLLKRTDNFNHSTTYSYDLITNQPNFIHHPPIHHSNGTVLDVTEQASYDTFGRKILSIDANGYSTSYTYNLYGSPTSIHYPDQSAELFEYTSNGMLTSHTLPNGLKIDYQHDVLGNIISKTFSFKNQLLGKETFTYKGHKLLKSVDLEGNQTQYTYDGLGRKISEERGHCLTTYQYDSLGNISRTCEENGDHSLYTNFKRDLLGRVLEKTQTDAAGTPLNKIAYSYDGKGNVHTIEKAINGKIAVETFTYDAYNRKTVYKDALGNETNTHYDESAFHLGQQVLKKYTKDPLDVTTVETYDPYGRIVKVEKLNDASQIISSRETDYDACGYAVLRKDHVYQGTDFFTTQAIRWTYDPCHRVKKMTRAFNTPDARTTEWTYHTGGKIATKTLADHMLLSYVYDPFDNLTAIESSDGKIWHTFTYDRLGHLLTASDELNDLKIKRDVDCHGNVLLEEFPNGIQVKKTYDQLHRPLSMSLPDGGEVVYEYDSLYLRKVRRLSFSGKILYEHTYDSYDESGYLLTEHLVDFTPVNYATDAKGQPVEVFGQYFKEQCSYDPLGNKTSQIINGTDKEFTYDEHSQLISEPGNVYRYDSLYNRIQENDRTYKYNALNEQMPAFQFAMHYDERGNLKEKGVTKTFCYDPLDRLIEVEEDDKKICYSYDPLGRKISKTVGEKKEFFLYDGKQEMGTLSEKGEIRQLRIIGRNTIAIELGGKVYAPLIDSQGNIRTIVDIASHTQAASYDYTAFGKQHPMANKVFNPWQYASKRYDPDCGLIDFGKRHYDPQLGRWLSLDPAGFIDSHNLYQYCLNNPYRYCDPDGNFLFFVPFIWGTVAAGAGAATVVAIEITAADVLLGALVTGAAIWGINEGLTAVDHAINNRRLAPYNQEASVEDEKEEKKEKIKPRTEPRDLGEKLTLDEAKAGAGKRIMEGQINDPNYPEDKWAKKQHTRKNQDGTSTTIHYWEDLTTGVKEGFKFKN